MKLYIAEKPLVANAIAKALNAINRKNGYYENENEQVQVSWSIGHLVGLAMPEFYNEDLKKWSKETLPIIPKKFLLNVKKDGGLKKQFNILKNLLNNASEIVCATDNDREGDLIFHYIYTLSDCKTPYRRILPNDLSMTGIKNAIEKETDSRPGIVKSAECRAQSDWLVGINATRAITVASNQKITMGRVQSPTLALVTERYLANKNFKPEPYYPITIDLEKEGISFKAKIKDTPLNEEEAKTIVSNVATVSECTFSEKKEVKEKQPLPFFLSTLQIEASNKFGFSPQKTLDLAQALYEKHKLTTYPRTDSGYLTQELYKGISNTLSQVLNLPSISISETAINLINLPTNCINNKKAPNHHGIIPTNDLSGYKNLDKDEKSLFDLIALRFLAAFAEICIKDKTKYVFNNSRLEFISNGSVIKQEGWREIFSEPDNEDKEKEDENATLPDVSENDSLPTLNPGYSSKLTKAPALLTSSTLITLMKSCGKNLDDAALKKAMQDNDLRQGGLATEATKGGIIENLFKVGLISNDKKKIVPTDMGLSLYKNIKDLDIAKPILTAQWELKLDQIANDEYDATQFISEIASYTTSITSDLLNVGANIDTDNLKLSCPKCNTGKLIEGKKGYGCNRWNEDNDPCNFVIWKKMSGKKISLSIASELVENKVTKSKIKGFEKKDKSSKFDAFLKLDDTFKVTFDFANKDKSGKILKCPKCQKEARINGGGIFCSNKDNCDFKMWRKMAEKTLSDSQLLQLLSKKKTTKIKGFKSKAGKDFDAALTMKDDFTVSFKF